MFCKNCGAEIREGASFCGSCGTPVGGSTAADNQEPVINFSEMGQKAKAVAGKGVEGAKKAADTLNEKINKMTQEHQEKKKAQQEELARMQAMAPNPAQTGQNGYVQGAQAGYNQQGPAQGYNQNVPPQGGYASGYGFAPIWNYKPNYNYKPIGMWGYFGWDLLFLILSIIPLIGWIIETVLLLILSFRSHGNINLRNYARSKFCVLIIIVVIFVAIGIVSRAGLFWLFKI